MCRSTHISFVDILGTHGQQANQKGLRSQLWALLFACGVLVVYGV